MYYAQHNSVGTGDLPQGAIEITRDQYLDAIERMSGGERIAIIAGEVVFYTGPVQLLDENGFHVGEADELPEGAPLITDKPEGFVKPKRVNGAWVEGEDASVLFERAVKAKLGEINAAYEQEMSAIKAGYPLSEVLSWDKQEAEARAYQADSNAATPFIDALATERGMAKAELVSRIMAKVDMYEQTVGMLTGKRQRLEDQVLAAQTVEGVSAVTWTESQ